ncbi:MAG: PTS lactose/cellobiose transporter subunit IIA [Clostridium sp.]
MEELELVAFEIISEVGTAKSLFMEALEFAENGDFEKAEATFQEGKEQLTKGHHPHMKLVQQEAAGEGVKLNLLLMHAEDQLMTTEILKELVGKMINIHKKL